MDETIKQLVKDLALAHDHVLTAEERRDNAQLSLEMTDQYTAFVKHSERLKTARMEEAAAIALLVDALLDLDKLYYGEQPVAKLPGLD
jgi:hypothetical protein